MRSWRTTALSYSPNNSGPITAARTRESCSAYYILQSLIHYQVSNSPILKELVKTSFIRETQPWNKPITIREQRCSSSLHFSDGHKHYCWRIWKRDCTFFSMPSNYWKGNICSLFFKNMSVWIPLEMTGKPSRTIGEKYFSYIKEYILKDGIRELASDLAAFSKP